MKWNPKLIYKTCNVWVFGICQIVSHMAPPHPNSNTYKCNLILLFFHILSGKIDEKDIKCKKNSETQN